MFEIYSSLAERALDDRPPSGEEAHWILDGEDVEILPLLHAAYVPRQKYFGRKVMVHILNNLQCGLCPEDCGYCSQNKDSKAKIRQYTMKSDEEILREAERVAKAGATRYCMVLSGRGPSVERARRLGELIREVKERYPIEVCLSCGVMGDAQARILAEAGLDRLNHNLNTSESHYPEICSTHTYQDRLSTLLSAKKHGIETCSGLIIGMGEKSKDIIDVAGKLRELAVPSIPVNFLIPIEGNQITCDGTLSPERCLRALCLMRFFNPRAEIRAAAGREGHLRSLQPLALYPANSIFVEGYLTTLGDATRETYRMVADAGFEIGGNALYDGSAEANDASFVEGGYKIPGGGDRLIKPEIAAQ
jgi:biotin synthase